VGDALDIAEVGLNSEEFLAGLRIPHLRPIIASGGQTFAIRAEGYATVPVFVRLDGEKFAAGLRIQYLYVVALALTAYGQAFAVRAEGHGRDRGGSGFERKGHLGSLGTPYLHRLVPARGQVFAIRTEGQVPDSAVVTLKRDKFLARVRIPQPH